MHDRQVCYQLNYVSIPSLLILMEWKHNVDLCQPWRVGSWMLPIYNVGDDAWNITSFCQVWHGVEQLSALCQLYFK